MEGMRTLLRSSLRKSLVAASDADRLAAAWTVVCGRPLCERGTVVGYADGVAEVEAVDAVWLRQMQGMRQQLVRELKDTAGVPVRELRFSLPGSQPGMEANRSRSQGGVRHEQR